MGFYFRKSVRVGPIRLNFSRSGVGISAGVRGFRYGVRPNGRAYVHAGRYGLYYREDLGDKGRNRPGSCQLPAELSPPPVPPTEIYAMARAAELSQFVQTDLVRLLNDSYRRMRLDYVSAVLFGALCLGCLSLKPILAAIPLCLGVLVVWLIGRWETRRRTVYVCYDLDPSSQQTFERLVSGFNELAACRQVWVLDSSAALTTLQQRKLHAGASNLVTRSSVGIGEGTPPWVEANVTIPTIIARQQTLYFMPDGVLVYDNSGVAHVDYHAISVAADTSRFVEPSPPADAQVIGHTWAHPNRDGGPDRRFANNCQIPLCLYGDMVVRSQSGFLLYLQTSRSDVPNLFQSAIQHLAALAFSVKPSVEVNREHLQSLGSCILAGISAFGTAVIQISRAIDRFLEKVAGRENQIVHWFLRGLAIVGLFVTLGALLAYVIARVVH